VQSIQPSPRPTTRVDEQPRPPREHVCLDRRRFLAGAAAGAATLALPVPAASVSAAEPDVNAASASSPFAALGHSLREERTSEAQLEGRLPDGLRGTLFRNGPGLFERNGLRKRTLLDGDGLIQAFDFKEEGVRYRNRFVRTHKFVEEEAAGRFLHPTWTTLADGWHHNLPGIPTQSQAGVAALVRDGRLLALDEAGHPWALDPKSLETQGERPMGPADAPSDWKAHSRIDGETGDWITLGSLGDEYHVLVHDRHDKLREHHRVPARRRAYIHDFFATPRYVVLNIHAASYGPKGLLLMTGFASVRDALVWNPELGNSIIVIDRSGEREPLELEAPASWMWHAVNAYEHGDEILADFIGYDTPDHFLGKDAAFEAIMSGRLGVAESPGTLRRYVIDPKRKQLREETLDGANHEFPALEPQHSCRPHSQLWACTAERGVFHDGLVRIDMPSGLRDSFYFGAGHQVGEPVFAPDRDGRAGWILSLVFEASSQTSFVAVLRADAISDGPIAKARLDHHAPYSFHGTWWPNV
jgi:all-trans-8'-apo-beta-carotenal 15,15'-oxygenase